MGSKSSKRNSVNDQPLSRETIEELCQDTGFTEEELLTWHTNFYKDCPDGKLTLKHFEQEYARIMGKPTQKTANYVRHMFSVYDQDKNQFIDFKEFVMALSAASVVNRLRLVETLFHVFDLDNDGKITKDEIAKMLHTLVDVTNSNQKRRQRRHQTTNQTEHAKTIDIQKRVDDAFNELNANDDDHITKDEFIEWYMKSGLLSEVQTNELDVPDTSRIQHLGKKSRKFMKQSSNTKSTSDHEENGQRLPQLVRHMSRMTERRVPTKYDDNDDDDDVENDFRALNSSNNVTTVSARHYHDENGIDGKVNRPTIRITTSSDDTDSQLSKENERWQHLFNSVLGQIRAQRTANAESPTTNNLATSSSFQSWKREGEEKLKSEYIRQKSTDTSMSNRSFLSTKNDFELKPNRQIYENQPPASPDIVSVRL
ncbi:unnamed protein product [Adineta ricciae]|uniref:EF-hand domain-containing protein n=2 Tax=Adineta ricciae TaxID=249248 RepID=A0A814WUV1_ADIRI|nr:unnamed protein product [Adineta ricciae]